MVLLSYTHPKKKRQSSGKIVLIGCLSGRRIRVREITPQSRIKTGRTMVVVGDDCHTSITQPFDRRAWKEAATNGDTTQSTMTLWLEMLH